MRIISLNAWGGRLFEDMVSWIARAQPDVLCLQEVVYAPGSPSAWLDYREGAKVLPQRADVLRDVMQALPDHGVTFCPAACGNLWLGEREVPTLWGLATFLHPDLTVIGQAQGFVHGTFSPDGFGPHPRSRSAHVVRVWHPDEGGITIGQMHGLRDRNGKMDTPVRGEQARKFAGMVQSVLHPGDPVVACGDFNVLPGSETFRIMARVAPYNLVTGRGHEGTRTSYYEKPERHADYMLVNGPLKDADFAVIHDPEISDHCPLVLDTV